MGMKSKLLAIVKGNYAEFEAAYDGGIWYQVVYPYSHDGHVTRETFRFKVPFEDIAGGKFRKDEKAIHLMRWIRKQLEENENED